MARKGRGLSLSQALFSQGFGTRRACEGLVWQGLVQVNGQACDDPDTLVEPQGLVLQVEGQDWPYREQAVVVLHKPTGYECSLKPRHHPSVMNLLPPPLRQRGLQPIGRLDEDTTGLLLLTDDGPLNHRLTSPKWHVPKTYRALCDQPLQAAELQQLEAGVMLEDDPRAARALRATTLDDGALELVIDEGRYHQVKRMVAAVGRRVVALHRTAFGSLTLPADLAPGRWRWLDEDEERGLRESERIA